VKLAINYSSGSKFLGENKHVMCTYDRLSGSLIKLSSFPNGFILNNAEGTIKLTSTLTKIHNISAIATLTESQ
jgi:hypothetical protein